MVEDLPRTITCLGRAVLRRLLSARRLAGIAVRSRLVPRAEGWGGYRAFRRDLYSPRKASVHC